MEALEECRFVDLLSGSFVDCGVGEAVHLGEVSEELLLVVYMVDAEFEFRDIAGIEVELWLLGGGEGLVGAECEVGRGCGEGSVCEGQNEEQSAG